MARRLPEYDLENTNLSPRQAREEIAKMMRFVDHNIRQQVARGRLSPQSGEGALQYHTNLVLEKQIQDQAWYERNSRTPAFQNMLNWAGASLPGESAEGAHARKRRDFDTAMINLAIDGVGAGVTPPRALGDYVAYAAPDVDQGVRTTRGYGERVGLDQVPRKLSDDEEIDRARSLAFLHNGYEIEARPAPEEKPTPPPSYPRSRDQWSDIDQPTFNRMRAKEEAEARKRQAYDGSADESADAEEPREF